MNALTVIVSLFTTAVYVTTAYGTVAGGDSGELVTAAYHLGVAHPPGYPLFTMLAAASIEALRSSGMDVAQRVNVLCALLGGLAAGGLFRALFVWLDGAEHSTSSTLLHHSPSAPAACGGASAGTSTNTHGSPRLRLLCALVGSMGFALSGSVWHSCSHAEVFALNNALCAWLLAAAAAFFTHDLKTRHLDSSQRVFVGARRGALLAGLALSNQHTSALLIAPLLAAVLPRLLPTTTGGGQGGGRFRVAWERLQGPGVFFCVGLAPYLYLPWAAARGMPTSWGGRDVASWSGFLRHVTRSEYGTFRLAPRELDARVFLSPDHLTRIWLFVSHLSRDSGGVAPFLSLWGLFAIFAPPPQKEQARATAGGACAGGMQSEEEVREQGVCGSGRRRGGVGVGGARSGGGGEGGRGGGSNGLVGLGSVVVGAVALHLFAFLALSNVDISDPTSRYVLARFWPQVADVC